VIDRDAFALELAREWVRAGLPRRSRICVNFDTASIIGRSAAMGMPRSRREHSSVRDQRIGRHRMQSAEMKGVHRRGVSTAVPTVNSIQLAYSRESGDACAYGRHPQTDLAGSVATAL
jgi:hypothetical protein